MSRLEPVIARIAPVTSWRFVSTFFFEKPASGAKQTRSRPPSRLFGRASRRIEPIISRSLHTSSATAGQSATSLPRSSSPTGDSCTSASGCAATATGEAAPVAPADDVALAGGGGGDDGAVDWVGAVARGGGAAGAAGSPWGTVSPPAPETAA